MTSVIFATCVVICFLMGCIAAHLLKVRKIKRTAQKARWLSANYHVVQDALIRAGRAREATNVKMMFDQAAEFLEGKIAK